MTACLSLAAALLSCPYCEAPGLTLSEQLAGSDTVVLAEWLEADRGGDASPAFTRFRVRRTVKGPYEPGRVLKLAGYQSGKIGETVLLTAGGGEIPQWDLPVPITKDGFAYLQNAPAGDAPLKERIAFYLKHLEHPDDLVAGDAYGEFGGVPFEEVERLSDMLPREKLAAWVGSEDTDPARIAFYGMLLGLCGEKSDADLLRSKIFGGTDEYRIGIDGLMSGFLLLTREAGLEELEAAKLKSEYVLDEDGEPVLTPEGEKVKVPFSEIYAALQAVRFMWTYGGDRIPQERLKQSLRLLLDRPDMADVVITDLSRWQDWAAMDRVAALFDAEGYDVPAIDRAIVKYLLEAERDLPESPGEAGADEEAPAPEHVTKAREHLAKIAEADPQVVERAKRLLYLEF